MQIVSYGGGINSTAMILGLHDRGIRPDAILFADTGGEHPRTYAFVAAVSAWCEAHGFPPVTTCRKQCDPKLGYTTLESECLTQGRLPSLAYGFHKCADKWKVQAQLQWVRAWQPAADHWAAGGTVTKLIGFHADEQRRIKPHIVDRGYTKRYPLVEWGWRQEDCRRRIADAGLPTPEKSACFFCPATTKHQVRRLAQDSPKLFARAVAIEHAAQVAGNLQTVVGLGRHWTWESVAKADECQLKLFGGETQTPCGCWDGDDEDDD